MDTFLLHANKVKKETLHEDVQFNIEGIAKLEGKDEKTYDNDILYSRFPDKDFITIPNGIMGGFDYEFNLNLDERHFVNCKIIDKTTLFVPDKNKFTQSFTSYLLEKKDKTKSAFCFYKNEMVDDGDDHEQVIVLEF